MLEDIKPQAFCNADPDISVSKNKGLDSPIELSRSSAPRWLHWNISLEIPIDDRGVQCRH